jgi:protoporphyrinogen oxidase
MSNLTKEIPHSGIQETPDEHRSGKSQVAILGAGPAGVTAALGLVRSANAEVIVLERSNIVGGNAGSFLFEDIWCDHGSHRLHPVSGERVLDEVRAVLGEDLLWRPRHGRIRLGGRWIHFPLKPFDLLSRLPKSFATSLALDMVLKLLPRGRSSEETFATVLRRGLGPTICDSFYYPYVQKLWGIPPTELAVKLAERRVSGSSVSKILQKIARQTPGMKSQTAGGFYYPRKGFGQITQGLHDSAVAKGATVVLGADVTGINCKNGRAHSVRYEKDGQVHERNVDAIWSTLPISMLVKMIQPAAPAHVLDAANKIRFRGMILIYLVLEQDQFSEYDAHYFPELSIPISRMSEPKNYSASREPRGRTVLCAELPSDPDRPEWKMTDAELGKQMCQWLEGVGLQVKAPVKLTMTRKLKHAYPVYDRNYESHFKAMDSWLAGISGLLTFGRQGLFAHDNTHHAMTMAFAAVDCFGRNGEFDWQRWANYRHEFESHVVED